MESGDVALDELERLRTVLEQAKLLHSAKREMTFFDTALRKHYENPTTELLSFFINPENKHGLHSVFYQGLLSALASSKSDYGEINNTLGDLQSVQTEVITDNGRIDLLIETNQAVLVIECKISHHQNNPFSDYQQYVQKKYSDKQAILLILCVNGKSHVTNWRGLSYRQFGYHTKSFLAEALLAQPYNKWALFAREFLMHWEQLGVDMINQQQMDFVVEHVGDIKKMVTLRDDFYQHVCARINEALVSRLEGYETYGPFTRTSNWTGAKPALRFANNHCSTWTEVVVSLHIDEQPLKYDVKVRLDKQTDTLVKLVCKEFKKLSWDVVGGENTWTEQKDRYWVCLWEEDIFDLNQIIEEVVLLMRVLMKAEGARKIKFSD